MVDNTYLTSSFADTLLTSSDESTEFFNRYIYNSS